MDYGKQSLKFDIKNRNKHHVESTTLRLIEYYADKNKKDRKAKYLCRYCYYFSPDRIGGSAITNVVCACCDESMSFCNTCVDVVCSKCAGNYNICKHCSQKID